MTIKPRDLVRVSCVVEPGMFSNERAVGVLDRKENYQVWFFAYEGCITGASNEGTHVLGEVLEADGNEALVRFRGTDGCANAVISLSDIRSAS